MRKENFPNLFAEAVWEPVRCGFDIMEIPPPLRLIGNVNIVAFRDEQCLIIQLQDRHWEIPGGTLEPGETYWQTIERELLEEAGARLLTFEIFGAWHCMSSATKPYRPHLPHPEFYRVVGFGAVELVSAPQNPSHGESVVHVEWIQVKEAVERFLNDGRPELAELYQLAAQIRDERSINCG